MSREKKLASGEVSGLAVGSAAIRVDASGHIVAILQGLGMSLAIASYQASVVILASATADGLSVLPRSFDKPMGLAASGDRLAIAARNEALILAPSGALAPGYPRAPNAYGTLWLPRSLFYTGEIDLHDPAFANGALFAVATRFSCIARIDDGASFTPVWKPPFVTDLVAEDRCHLNGMALDEAGAPRFVTALGATNMAEGWRAGRAAGGVLVSVPDGRVVLDGLCMPHSPRLIGGVLHLLNSGAGEVLRVDPATGTAQVLARLPGYARGLVARGDFLFVGLSRLRDRRGAGDAPLPVERGRESLICGVVALDRHSGRVLGRIDLVGGVDEVSDLALLPGTGRHGILNHADPAHRLALALPGQGFWAAAPDPSRITSLPGASA
ncbi:MULTISPECIES: TIGR03032 family protein [Roseomonadaceae]|uniref:TIGR03032 family protein n=1 Tax=Roseomonadaceae TaxID=3385906 RepID=UPI0022A83305|nr:TIGR03032 family protein [Roseomonas oleicola]